MTDEAQKVSSESPEKMTDEKKADKAEVTKEAKKPLRSVVPSVLIALLGAFTLCGYVPIVSYLGNASEFYFSLESLLWEMALPFALIFVVLLALFLLVNKIFPTYETEKMRGSISWLHIVVLAAIVCLWLEGFLLNQNLAQITGEQDLFTSVPRLAIDSVIWGVVLILALRFWRKIAKHATALFVCVTLILCLGIGDAALASEPKGDLELTSSDVLDRVAFNSEDNVLVMVLDATSTALILDKIDEQPSIKDDLQGFVFFKNNLQTASSTQWSLPSILRGDLYEGGPILEYQEDYLAKEDSLPQRFGDQGYDVYISSTLPLFNAIQSEDAAEVEANKSVTLTETLYGQLFFRFAPYAMKNSIANEVGVALSSQGQGALDDGNLATLDEDDYSYYDKVTYGALENAIGKTNSAKPTLQFHHVSGSHMPYLMDEDGNALPDSERQSIEGLHQQTTWTIDSVISLLDDMKEQGIYDSTTIVLMADHGDRNWQKNRTNEKYYAYASLLVKPANRLDDFTVSEAPTSNMYLPELLEAIHLEGKDIEEVTADLPAERSMFNTSDSIMEVYEGSDVTKMTLVDSYLVDQTYSATTLERDTVYAFTLINENTDLPIAYPQSQENANFTNGWGLKLLGSKSNVTLVTADDADCEVSLKLETAAKGGGSAVSFQPYTLTIRDLSSSQTYSFEIDQSVSEIAVGTFSCANNQLALEFSIDSYSDDLQYFIKEIAIKQAS